MAEGTAIGLTGGTTTTEVARALVALPRLTVVTNSLNIASELAVRPNLKLVVTGGVARAESYELVGPLAEATLAGLNIDMVFVGVDGISARAGLTTHHEVEAHTNRALIDRAQVVTVVADSSKLGDAPSPDLRARPRRRADHRRRRLRADVVDELIAPGRRTVYADRVERYDRMPAGSASPCAAISSSTIVVDLLAARASRPRPDRAGPRGERARGCPPAPPAPSARRRSGTSG